MKSNRKASPRVQGAGGSSDRSCLTTTAAMADTHALVSSFESLDSDAVTPRTAGNGTPRSSTDCSTPRGALGPFAFLSLKSPCGATASSLSHEAHCAETCQGSNGSLHISNPVATSSLGKTSLKSSKQDSPSNDPFKTPVGTPRHSGGLADAKNPYAASQRSFMSPLALIGSVSPRSVRIVSSARLSKSGVVPVEFAWTCKSSPVRHDRPASAPLSAEARCKDKPMSEVGYSSGEAVKGPRTNVFSPKPPVRRALPFSQQQQNPWSPDGEGSGGALNSKQHRELSFSDFLNQRNVVRNDNIQVGMDTGIVCGCDASMTHEDPGAGQLTPRKRPRKNVAPQRADLDEAT